MATASRAPEPDAWKHSTNPLDHVTKSEESTTTGNKGLTCKHCDKTFNGGATRAYIHLTGDGKGVSRCTKIPQETVNLLKAGKAARDVPKQGVKRPAGGSVDDRSRSHAAAGPGPSSQAQQQQQGQQTVGDL